jgi:hypothetical protein
MDINEFQRLGFLQEANRLFFHPLGLSLAIERDDDGSARLHSIWDYRSDPEGMLFADKPDQAKADKVEAERDRHTDARGRIGCVDGVQPVTLSFKEQP